MIEDGFSIGDEVQQWLRDSSGARDRAHAVAVLDEKTIPPNKLHRPVKKLIQAIVNEVDQAECDVEVMPRELDHLQLERFNLRDSRWAYYYSKESGRESLILKRRPREGSAVSLEAEHRREKEQDYWEEVLYLNVGASSMRILGGKRTYYKHGQVSYWSKDVHDISEENKNDVMVPSRPSVLVRAQRMLVVFTQDKAS
ncbi:MAG: hypothetical protein Q7S79_00330 [bacterium]|nr:hypothetical protein [bacterium]